MTKSTRQVELFYIRLQTIIAAASVLSATTLSAIGIYIALQLNEANDRNRSIDQIEQKSAALADRQMKCIDVVLRMSNLEGISKDLTDIQKLKISSKADAACNGTGLSVRELTTIRPSPDGDVAVVPKSLSKDAEWKFEGPFGRVDQQALQSGYRVYKDVCTSCQQQADDLDAFLKWASEGHSNTLVTPSGTKQ